MSQYSNPANTCFQCEQMCCDSFSTDPCLSFEKCDNEFFYCLMPLDSIPLTESDNISDTVLVDDRVNARAGCLQPSTAQRSEINLNGEMIDFRSEIVLGLPNPLEFEMSAVRWQVS